MGPSTTNNTNTTAQTNQLAIQHCIQLTPSGSPLFPSNPFHTSPTNTQVGGTPILFPYGKYMYALNTPPSAYLQQVLHQHHLGKFFQIFCLV